ncbi:hypothetical protein [Vibrio sp. VPAP30]|uniref:hypothetical protein n=1 Tax=Vibrio sp. VPAP30 TaxID=1647102 RepID=UPI0006587218|nr:hypothetical protein [Vibrio sp. VPAP30]KLN63537.1 hypothetical protein ZX61_18585 [Vibrio sp. VPAP30]
MHILPLFIALILVISSLFQLVQVAYTSSLTYSLSLYSDEANFEFDEQRVGNERLLVETTLYLPNVGAHQYELAANILSWHSFLRYQNASLEEVNQYLIESIRSRPTWYAPYLQMSRFSEKHSVPAAIEYPEKLAMRFGPYMNETKLVLYDKKFSQWEMLTEEEQIALTVNFLASAQSYRFRRSLKGLLESSKGAERMCKLLAFNAIDHSSCRES